MANAATLKIEIGVNDKGSPVIRKFGDVVDKSGKKASKSLGFLNKDLGGVGKSLLNIKTLAATAFVGWGLSRLSASLIETASSMENLQASLDTITKGQGAAWFQELNSWAMTMPVNTGKAIDSFRMMRAMGLQPTIDQMTTLVDTMAALGGGEDALEGISRALGQMQTKGKLSAEELMQLAERGVPAYQILSEKLGLTGDQLANIGAQGITAQQGIAALLEGMNERFGGMSEKMQNMWSGIMEGLKAYWVEFQRLVMNSGAFTVLKETLGEIRDKIGEMYEDGRLAQWASKTGKAIADSIAAVVKVLGYIPAAFFTAKEAASEFMAYVASAAKGILNIFRATPIGLLTKAADKIGKWLGDDSVLSKPMEFINSMSSAIDEFAMSQIAGADAAAQSAQKWMDIGIEVEGFANDLQKQIDDLADQVAESADQAASNIAQANALLSRGMEETSNQAIEAVLKTAKADLDAVNQRLTAYRSFYDQVAAMSERAREQEAAHIKELAALEKARADARNQTGDLVQGLREMSMDPLEKYESRRTALNQQYAQALRMEGQDQVDALKSYQQAVSSLAQEFTNGVVQSSTAFGQTSERTVVTSREVIDAAVSDIQRAGAAVDRAFADMQSAKEKQIQADRAWADSLSSTAADAAQQIQYLSNLAASLEAQIQAMDTQIAIQGEDRATSVIQQIQAELDSLHDKTVTVTVKTIHEGSGASSGLADPEAALGSYATGTRFVPRTGLYTLHKGEEVTPGHKTQGQGGGVSIGQITINVPQGTATQSPEDWRSITRNIIVPELQRLGRN